MVNVYNIGQCNCGQTYMVQRHLVALGWGHILEILIYHIENPKNEFVPSRISKSSVPADSSVTSIPDPMSLGASSKSSKSPLHTALVLGLQCLKWKPLATCTCEHLKYNVWGLGCSISIKHTMDLEDFSIKTEYNVSPYSFLCWLPGNWITL